MPVGASFGKSTISNGVSARSSGSSKQKEADVLRVPLRSELHRQ